MSITDKAEQAVKKLLEATRENLIEWERSPIRDNIEVLGLIFVGQFQGKKFAVFKRKLPLPPPAPPSYGLPPPMSAFAFTLSPGPPRTEVNEIALLDSVKTILWVFPETKYTDDLYRVVHLKACKIEETLDEIVSGF
ncbi:MAG: hypothetical protein ACKVY0_29495 [Prosthecobacter sp.]|uniref:hypothetical protein n=1 Tax=Prosthecobacter sp. TaxID=1965333 RepID=UPI0039024540